MTDLEPSLPERAVARLAATLDRSRPPRRSFLAGLVVSGSALALKPWRYLVEDASAIDVVCGAGNECSDGWTAFCCTVSGANACPPGSFAAGWWKADNSGFCCGSARYYIDCNATCGSNWQCRCASGTCDRRRVACNQFRYGQCHQEIACYGPVVCRVVTCQPPWQWDAACTTLSLTDNRTASHSAPCLGRDCLGPVEQLWSSTGGASGPLGAKIADEAATPPRGSRTLYAKGAIYRNGSTVYEVHGSIWSLYSMLSQHSGPLGYPRSNTLVAADGRSKISLFDRGAIVYRPGIGTFEVRGRLWDKWNAMGRERSAVRYPLSNMRNGAGGAVPYGLFDLGAIFARGSNTLEIHGDIYDMWRRRGGTDVFGFPTTNTATGYDGRTRFSMFDNGTIFYRPGRGTYEIHGAIHTKWRGSGGSGRYGYATTNTTTGVDGRTRYNLFDKGAIFYRPGRDTYAIDESIYDKWRTNGQGNAFGYPTMNIRRAPEVLTKYCEFDWGAIFARWGTGTIEIHGDIFHAWKRAGGIAGLGYPTADTVTQSNGLRVSRFDRGRITYDPARKTTTVTAS